METLKAPFRLSDVSSQYEKAKKQGKMPMEIAGTDGFARYYTMDCIGTDRTKLIITHSEDRAKEILDESYIIRRKMFYFIVRIFMDIRFYDREWK